MTVTICVSGSRAALFQALNDVGWTIPAAASCYWVGEAMQSIDFKDLPQPPEKIVQSAQMLAANAAHLSRLLSTNTYPSVPHSGG